MTIAEQKNETKGRRSTDRSLMHGIAWNGLARWSGQIVSWAVLLYAARILTPEDFGYVAMAMVPIGLARLIEDLGLDAALVQNTRLTEGQIASLGGVALCVGIGLMTTYLVLAGLISKFYGEPRVANIVRVLSLLFVLDALQIVPRALLQKELQFGRLAFVNGTQITSSALILGICTFLDYSYWALVLNHVLSHALIVLILFYFRRHRLSWPDKWNEIAQSLKFGGHMLASRIAWYGYTNADQLLLGRFAGANALGAYNFAMTFARVPVDEISSLTGKVVPGVFSSIQHSYLKLTRYLLLLTEATSYLTVPATIGVGIVASDFVPVAIGDQWNAVILPLQVLAIYTCIKSVTTLWTHVLIWTGHARAVMLLSLFSFVVLVSALWFGVKFGIAGVAIAWATADPITLVPLYWILGRILHLRFRKFILCLGPALVSTAIMCAGVLLTRELFMSDWSTVGRLGTSVTVGVFVYCASLLLIFGRQVRRVVRTIRRSF